MHQIKLSWPKDIARLLSRFLKLQIVMMPYGPELFISLDLVSAPISKWIVRDVTNSSHVFSSYREQLCIHLFAFKNFLGNLLYEYPKYAGLDIVYTHVNKHKHTKDEERRKNQDEKKASVSATQKRNLLSQYKWAKRKKGKRQHSLKVAVSDYNSDRYLGLDHLF